MADRHRRLSMKDADCCLVIEDARALREYASSLISQTIANPSLCVLEADSTSAVEQFSKHKPGMVVMDIITRVRNGMGLAKFIWEHQPATKILFWTQLHSEALVRELGRMVPDEAIHGYVLKSEGKETLQDAIACVFAENNPY